MIPPRVVGKRWDFGTIFRYGNRKPLSLQLTRHELEAVTHLRVVVYTVGVRKDSPVRQQEAAPAAADLALALPW